MLSRYFPTLTSNSASSFNPLIIASLSDSSSSGPSPGMCHSPAKTFGESDLFLPRRICHL